MSETPTAPSLSLFEIVVLTIVNVGALVVIWKWIVPEIRKNIILAVKGEV
ncbi:MAG: hypothetical protein QXZ68_04770 [Candidatus Bathyarchaeia archaeon]